MKKLKRKKKIGLALGGGVVLGAAHIGVLRAVEEFDIKISYLAGTSIGALIAAVGTGMFSSVREACDATISIGKRYSPDTENAQRYEDGYDIYKELYPSLKKSFHQNTQLLTKYK